MTWTRESKARPLFWLLSQISTGAKQLAQYKGSHYSIQQTSIVSLHPAGLTRFLPGHSNCNLESKPFISHDWMALKESTCLLQSPDLNLSQQVVKIPGAGSWSERGWE